MLIPLGLFFPNYNDVNWQPFVILTGLICLWWLFQKDIHLSLPLPFKVLVTAITSISLIQSLLNFHSDPGLTSMTLLHYSLMSLLFAGLALIYILNVKPKPLTYVLMFCFALQAVKLTWDYTWYEGAYGLPQGYLGNKSIGATYLAVLAPLLGPWWVLAALAVSVYVKSLISILAVCVTLMVYLPLRWGLLAASLSVPALYLTGRGIFSNARFEFWPIIATYVPEHLWIGHGLGSFQYFGPALQIKHQYGLSDGMWLFAHNDWLEILFEQGLVGLGLVVIAFVYWWVKETDIRVRGFLLSLSVSMFGNYPLQVAYFIPLIALAWGLSKRMNLSK